MILITRISLLVGMGLLPPPPKKKTSAFGLWSRFSALRASFDSLPPTVFISPPVLWGLDKNTDKTLDKFKQSPEDIVYFRFCVLPEPDKLAYATMQRSVEDSANSRPRLDSLCVTSFPFQILQMARYLLLFFFRLPLLSILLPFSFFLPHFHDASPPFPSLHFPSFISGVHGCHPQKCAIEGIVYKSCWKVLFYK